MTHFLISTNFRMRKLAFVLVLFYFVQFGLVLFDWLIHDIFGWECARCPGFSRTSPLNITNNGLQISHMQLVHLFINYYSFHFTLYAPTNCSAPYFNVQMHWVTAAWRLSTPTIPGRKYAWRITEMCEYVHINTWKFSIWEGIEAHIKCIDVERSEKRNHLN